MAHLDLSLMNAMPDTPRKGYPGVLVDGVLWYWDGEITQEAIAARRTQSTLRKVEMISAGVVAALAFGVFAFGVVFFHATDVLSFDFWTVPNAYVAAFWCGVIAACFLAYRSKVDDDLRLALPRAWEAAERTSVVAPEAASARRGFSRALSDDALSILEDAFDLALTGHHAEVSPIHIFAVATSSFDVRVLFARLGLTFEVLREPLKKKLHDLPEGSTAFGATAVEFVTAACADAILERRSRVTGVDVVAAAFAADPFVQEVLFDKGVTADDFAHAVAWVRIADDLRSRYEAFQKAAALKPTSNMNRAYTAVATPFLDAVSDDLTVAAVYGRTNMLIGREREMETILRAIEGGNQSVVLVGNSGVGRAAMIEGMAERMAEERVPDILADKRLLKLSVPHIVSAQGGSGADERFLYAMHEVASTGNVVLVIENIHELVGVGGGIDLASLLAGELEKGYTFVLATTTPDAYVNILERSALGPKLQRIAIEEPERGDAIRILEAQLGPIEAKHGVVFTYHAVAACVDLASRYMHEGVLPSIAIDVAKEVALEVTKRPRTSGPAWVRKEDVAALVSSRTNIPVTNVAADESQKLLQLEDKLHERVIGQHNAVSAVASALRRARTELRAEGRPIANFLFLGPTGVGKTEMAKTTAEVYFGNEQSMVRFDMSEYQDQASIARLIGGNGQSGLLTEAIRRAPFSLLLLDELEKAHPEILNLFLQVMDDGRLTDGLGRTIDFTNVILIATSNAGTQYIQDEVTRGASPEVMKTGLMEGELRKYYRPEFINRFDDVIVFTPLTQDDVAAIAYLMIDKIIGRLKEKGIALTVTDAAVHELAAAGYDPKFGARPLRRVLQERVENALAEKLLSGGVSRRDALIYDAGGRLEVVKAAEL